MVGYKKHLIVYFVIAAVSILGLMYYYNFIQFREKSYFIFFLSVLIGGFYTLLPDIDTPSSKLRGIISKIFLATILCCLIVYIIFIKDTDLLLISLGFVSFLYILWFSKHRRVFHSPVTGAILAFPLYFVNPYFFLFALIGFLTHLVIDGEIFK